MSTASQHGAPSRLFILGVIAVLAAAACFAGRSLEVPGLYYDEAVQARPALEWATGEVRATALPGSHVTWIAGRPVPLMTQPYMGALKSQVLAGSFSLFGADVRVLRSTTLGLALLGVGVLAFFSRRVFGEFTAWLATLLLAFDPSILLLARHDWGSFSLSFLLRGVVLFAGWRYWETRRLGALWLAAFALGLGFYNKIDFIVFATGTAIALASCAGRQIVGLFRKNTAAWAGAGVCFALGLGPLSLHIPTILSRPQAFGFEGETAEKIQTLWTLLDGSHFHRLMDHGGLFDYVGTVEGAPSGPLGITLLFAAAFVVFRWSTGGISKTRALRGGLFLLFANLATLAAFLALPGAVRIHHALNIAPFPQLLVAFVLADLAALGSDATRRFVPRLAIGLVVAVVVALQIGVYEQTHRAFAESGGRGRWSSASSQLARELQQTPTHVVSLDWGLHEPLAFLGAGKSLEEAHWKITDARRRARTWRARGNQDHLYVLHVPPYDLVGYGESFLEAARSRGPEFSEIRVYADGRGDTALVTVRFPDKHEILYDGNFAIRRLQ